MKFFSIELRRTAYVTMLVEATNKDEAEQMAWEELESDGSWGTGDSANWEVESIEEQT